MEKSKNAEDQQREIFGLKEGCLPAYSIHSNVCALIATTSQSWTSLACSQFALRH